MHESTSCTGCSALAQTWPSSIGQSSDTMLSACNVVLQDLCPHGHPMYCAHPQGDGYQTVMDMVMITPNCCTYLHKLQPSQGITYLFWFKACVNTTKGLAATVAVGYVARDFSYQVKLQASAVTVLIQTVTCVMKFEHIHHTHNTPSTNDI